MMGKGARGTYKMVVDSCFERGMLIVGVDKQFATPRSLQPPIYIHHLSFALPSFNSEKQTGIRRRAPMAVLPRLEQLVSNVLAIGGDKKKGVRKDWKEACR